MNVQLLIIDPQNSFCDQKGELFVAGATDDMKRLAKMVKRLSTKIDDIHVTLDSHRVVDVAHPIFWVNNKNQHPNPFTLITADDVDKGVWRTTNPGMQKRAIEYVHALDTNKRYLLCVWPEHCIIGTWGHSIFPEVSEALLDWERKNFGLVDYVTKGSNPYTEHYSAVKADVPDPEDQNTQMNTTLLDILAKADVIPVAGEARSHCIANTLYDIANNFGEENIQKICLLTDATSDVTGFEKQGEDFMKEMVGRGMKTSTTVDFLK